MKTLLLLISFFISIHFTHSQFFLNLKQIQTGPDGEITVVVSTINAPAGGKIFLNHITAFTSAQIYEGDTIHIPIFLDEYSILYTLSSDTILHANLFNSGKYQVLEYQEPTSMSATDGYLKIHIDSVQLVKPICYGHNGTLNYYVDSLDQNTFSINNLSFGEIFFRFNNNPSDTSTTMIYDTISGVVQGFLGDLSNLLLDNNLLFQVDYIDTDPSCNGSIQLNPINAIGGVVYTWSNDSTVVGDFQQNLCAGVYSIHAIDAASQEGLIEVYIIDSTNVYTDTTISIYTDTNSVDYSDYDSLFYDWVNCGLDYSLPIDSLYYNEQLLSVSATGDTTFFNFTLTIFQAGNIFLFSDSAYLLTDSTILYDIVIDCQLQKSTFSGKRIKFARTGRFNQASLHENTAESPILIYPNPSTDLITVKGVFKKGIITDLNGRTVMEINSKVVSLAHLQNGIYFLRLDEANRIFKIVKN